MPKQAEVVRGQRHSSVGALSRSPLRSKTALFETARSGIRDLFAGLVASVVLIANIVSFGALMFPGDLSAGIPVAIWSMLVGGCISGVWIALATSLPPLATGIDSPTGAVLVLLSSAVGSATLGSGGTPHAAVQTVMLLFTAATVITGVSFYVLGACRWGSYFRFIPYFVVGGFLAATGWFLVAGAVRMTAGQTLPGLDAGWTMGASTRLAAAVAVLLVLLGVRRWTKSAFAMPVALVAMWLLAVIVLRMPQLGDSRGGWYLPSMGTLAGWSPFEAVKTTHLTWAATVRLVPELLAVTIVGLMSLVTKVSTVEVQRQVSGNLDREFRAHGIGSLIAAPFGGLTSSLQTGTSRLLEHVGGATRMSGVIAALILGAVGVANLNLPGLIPIPVVAGLILYLGYTFLVDALWRPVVQRAWLDLPLTIFIMIVCVRYGYLVGVLTGIVCACVMFAISYARLGVVRRHVTRAMFASYVDRSPDATEHLRVTGDAIQVYWLSGYIFFGSSESVFERIRGDIQSLAPGRVSYVILDFGMVSGTDSTAVAGLAKLRNFCDKHDMTLVYCSLSPANRAALHRGGFFGGKSRHHAFADLNLALGWCEDQLIGKSNLETQPGLASFEPWLQQQLGGNARAADLVAYLERKDVDSAQVLYREGEPADTVDLVAVGSLAVDLRKADGEIVRIRRLMTHTVVGEMGFFRHSVRSATVSSDGPATVFTLSRATYERMRQERPDLASAFDEFIIRILANRIDLANRAVAALSEIAVPKTSKFARQAKSTGLRKS